MGAHHRRCNSSTTSAARPRTRPPASSAAVAPRRTSPPTNNNGGAACGKARKTSSRRRDTTEVRTKMEALRCLVPSSGCDDEVDELLLRAAGYIKRLQAQVTVMQLMVDVLEHTKD